MLQLIERGIKSNFLSHVLMQEGTGTVHSIFENSFNILLEGQLIHIGKSEAGLSAFGIVLESDWIDRIIPTLESNGFVKNKAGQLRLYGRGAIWSLDIDGFELVDCAIPRIERVDEGFLQEILHRFSTISFRQKSGLFAEPEHAQLFEQFLQSKKNEASFIKHFIGRGIGLTPSGDDFLMGFLLGCQAFQRNQAWVSLVKKQLQTVRTTTISEAYYETLILGYTSSHFKDLIGIIKNKDLSEWDTLVDRIGAYGHTSGWDTLYGLNLFLLKLENETIDV